MTTNSGEPSSFMDSLTISNEAVKSPYFGIVYGGDGVGKTHLCKFSDKPFYLSLEKGAEKVAGVGKYLVRNSSGLDVVYIPKSSDEFFTMLKKLANKKSPYKTVVIDGAMFLNDLFCADVISKEPHILVKVDGSDSKQLVAVNSLSDYDYTTGYERLHSLWSGLFLAGIDRLNYIGINVIMIAHARMRDALDANGDKYPKWQIDLTEYGNVSIPRLLSNRADFVFYMESEISTTKKKGAFGAGPRTVAEDTGTSIVNVYTRKTSRFNAKVRATIAADVKDSYSIDIYNDETSKQIFLDLLK